MIRRLLVTGGAGFIGSNFVDHWCNNYPRDRVVVLDALTYAGNRANLHQWEDQENFRFVRGDICDTSLVEELLQAEDISTIVHFAAESHVDRSILEPRAFVETNVMGTLTLLNAFRDRWMSGGKSDNYLFLHVSTDEVYGSLNSVDLPFTETTPYAPNSPYSASKAGSDHLVRAYHHTYQLPTIITNCSNNYGAYQFPEKLIPLMCINMICGKPLPIYGDGKNVRDWLYVEDHCRALDVVIRKGKAGETYNIGGNNEVENIQLVQTLCSLMDELADDLSLPVTPCTDLIQFVKDRPGHDRRYAIDASKMKHQLGWTPTVDITSGLRLTAQWYLSHRSWWQSLLSAEYQTYYDSVYGNGHRPATSDRNV
ncbi:MAG: dTDP-glucose 4,6-dehydratase [Cyanobacteria bacterium P01_A01_bin.84]